MKAPEPVPRTQPYSNRVPAGEPAPALSANASPSEVIGASAAAWRRLIASSAGNVITQRRPSAAAAAREARAANIPCRLPMKSARRPHIGPEMSRIAVPAPNKMPSCSGVSPRHWKKAGMNGEDTPKAPYMSAYSVMNRGSELTRRSVASMPATMLQAARNSAAMIGPMTNPFTPKTESPPSVATSTT